VATGYHSAHLTPDAARPIVWRAVARHLASYVPPEPRMWLINGAIQSCGIARLPDIRYLGHAAHELPGLHALGQPMARHPSRDSTPMSS